MKDVLPSLPTARTYYICPRDRHTTGIETARAARRYPEMLDALERGDLTLTAVRMLAPHLTSANYRRGADRRRHRSKQGIQELIASLTPRPEAATIIRRVAPQPSIGGPIPILAERETSLPRTTTPISSAGQNIAPTSAPQFPAAVLTPLAPERYKLQVTRTRETHEKLRRAQALARHLLPTGDVGSIIDRALTLLIDHLERRRFARVASPQPSSGESTAIGTSHTGGGQARSLAAR